ncbi:class I SAM-dependent methyltransferase [soil metagenome]
MLSEPTAVWNDSVATAHSDEALLELLRLVGQSGYRFITPTPLTHERVLANRVQQKGKTLTDIFGWNMRVPEEALSPQLLKKMKSACVLLPHGGLLRSCVRIASLDDDLFLHSQFPTSQENAVFFGPDTYRFARFIQQSLKAVGTGANGGQPMRIIDIGCGSGAGGIVAARCMSDHGASISLTMNDINPDALRYAAINAQHAGIPVTLALGDTFTAVDGEFDLVLSNPPYLADEAERAYRDGGAGLGRALSLRIVTEALTRLAPGGTLLLYTGVAIVDGVDPLRAEVLPLLAGLGCEWSYEEIDPDVFGEELEREVYAQADRIAAVGLVVTRNRSRVASKLD